VVRIARLTADDPCRIRQNTEAAGQHERSLGRRIVHVGKMIVTLLWGHAVNVYDLGAKHQHRPGRSCQVDGVEHDKALNRIQ
jgi:hypothetical protein